MKITGIQKHSLLDYPDKVSIVLFTQGCNFKCGFCHNPQLNSIKDIDKAYSEKEIFDLLTKRKKIVDAVVITGGEPTLYKDLPKFIKKIKGLGYLVKLDTNGSNPKLLRKIIKKKLVDYVAMDIKGPLEKYKSITNTNCSLKNIQRSIKLIMKSNVGYEFRSTLLPFWHQSKDIKNMAEMIQGAEKYYLQKFISRNELLSPVFKKAESFNSQQLKRLAVVVKKIVGHCEVR